MGKYSHTDLPGKVFSLNLVLHTLSIPHLESQLKLNLLVLINMLCKRRTPVTVLSLSFIMGHNKRTNSRIVIYKLLEEFIAAEYITKKGLLYKITELGKQQLYLVDYTMRRTVLRIKKNDPLTRNLPGPKKGQPMPNRWPEGQPKGRKPRSEGGK